MQMLNSGMSAVVRIFFGFSIFFILKWWGAPEWAALSVVLLNDAINGLGYLLLARDLKLDD